MVVPVFEQGVTAVKVFLPGAGAGAGAGVWYDAHTLQRYDVAAIAAAGDVPAPAGAVVQTLAPFSAAARFAAGVNAGAGIGAGAVVTLPAPAGRIPVLYRGGAVIPLHTRARRATQAQARDPISLLACLGAGAGAGAAGSVYVDDGASFRFQQGQYVYRAVTFAVSAGAGAGAGASLTIKYAKAPLPTAAGIAAGVAGGAGAGVAPEADGVVVANAVDKVTVLGLPLGLAPTGATVTGAGAGASVEAMPRDDATGALEVRLTGVLASAEFTVTVSLV